MYVQEPDLCDSSCCAVMPLNITLRSDVFYAGLCSERPHSDCGVTALAVYDAGVPVVERFSMCLSASALL